MQWSIPWTSNILAFSSSRHCIATHEMTQSSQFQTELVIIPACATPFVYLSIFICLCECRPLELWPEWNCERSEKTRLENGQEIWFCSETAGWHSDKEAENGRRQQDAVQYWYVNTLAQFPCLLHHNIQPARLSWPSRFIFTTKFVGEHFQRPYNRGARSETHANMGIVSYFK